MKYRTGKQREERKMLKAIGKWPIKPKKEKLFATERVLADASLQVHDLLINTMSNKKSRNQICNEARVRQPYIKLSDAKNKKKSVLMHRIVKIAKKRT